MAESELRSQLGDPLRVHQRDDGTKELFYQVESRKRSRWESYSDEETDYRGDVIERSAGWRLSLDSEVSEKPVIVSPSGSVSRIPRGVFVKSTP